MKEWKQPPVFTLQRTISLQCIYSVLVAKNHQKFQLGSLVFPSQIFFNNINHGYRAGILKNYLWLLPFFMAVATYCYFFFYVGFLSRTFTNHRTAGEGGGHFINSSLPLPPASQTLRH